AARGARGAAGTGAGNRPAAGAGLPDAGRAAAPGAGRNHAGGPARGLADRRSARRHAAAAGRPSPMAPSTSRAAVVLALALAAGCAASGPRQVSDSGAGAFEAALAATEDGFVVAWYDVRDGNAEIYARLLDPDGRPLEPERR